MKRGFSLIELMATVLIVGILASVALPQYRKAIERARTVEVWNVANYVEKMARISMTERSLSDTSDDSPICDTWLEHMGLTKNEHGVYTSKSFAYYISYCTNQRVWIGACRRTPPVTFPDSEALYCTDWDITRNGFNIQTKFRCVNMQMENACSSFFPDAN